MHMFIHPKLNRKLQFSNSKLDKNQKIHQRSDYKSMTMIMGGEDHMAIEQLSVQIERETDKVTPTSPQSRGGLLPLHHGDNGDVVGEDGDAPGSSGSGSPSNLSSFRSLFRCFTLPLCLASETRRGVFKQSVLGHGGDFEAKKVGRRCTGGKVGPMARPGYQAAPWAPLSPPWLVSSILLAPGSPRDGKISW